MINVIIAGGKGSRLWPLTGSQLIKPLLEVQEGQSLLKLTIGRIKKAFPQGEIAVLASSQLMPSLKEHLSESQLIWIEEPEGRDTAACVALAADTVQRERSGDETIGFFPADHLILNEDHFSDVLKTAHKVADESSRIVALGAKVETLPSQTKKYGYMVATDAEGSSGVRLGTRFIEKPDPEELDNLLTCGEVYQNYGMYFGRAEVFLEALSDYKKVLALRTQEPDMFATEFSRLPLISFDHQVMNHCQDFRVIPHQIERLDIGSFESLAQIWPQDAQGNVIQGLVHCMDSSQIVGYSVDKPVYVCGMDNAIVVNGSDAILVMNRLEAEKIKDVFQRYQDQNNG